MLSRIAPVTNKPFYLMKIGALRTNYVKFKIRLYVVKLDNSKL